MASARAGASQNDTPLTLRVISTAQVNISATDAACIRDRSACSIQRLFSLHPSHRPAFYLLLKQPSPPRRLSRHPHLPVRKPARTDGDTPSLTPLPPPRPSPAPEEWKTWPVVPALDQTAKAIYLHGQALGRDPHRFSKVGDCQNITTYFLSQLENPSLYRLGEYTSLQPAIDWFMGSFSRESLAVKGGMNVAAVLSPLRANREYCSQDESPLACEFRLYNPSFAIISMEEAWSGRAGEIRPNICAR